MNLICKDFHMKDASEHLNSGETPFVWTDEIYNHVLCNYRNSLYEGRMKNGKIIGEIWSLIKKDDGYLYIEWKPYLQECESCKYAYFIETEGDIDDNKNLNNYKQKNVYISVDKKVN